MTEVRCEGDDGYCRMPAAHLDGDALVIRSKHHGRRHETRIPLSLIDDLRRIEAATIDGGNRG